MTFDERYENFKREYEELCKKYEMSHGIYDMWDTGNEEIFIYDEKEKQFVIE